MAVEYEHDKKLLFTGAISGYVLIWTSHHTEGGRFMKLRTLTGYNFFLLEISHLPSLYSLYVGYYGGPAEVWKLSLSTVGGSTELEMI